LIGGFKMTRLKTLKDLDGMGEIILSIKNLKAEAVKWIKEKYNLKYTTGVGFHADMGWLEFREFFNITEEDLK